MQAAALGVTTGVVMGTAIDGPPSRRVSPYDASSMLEKGKRNKNGTKDIGIQAFDTRCGLSVDSLMIILMASVHRRWGGGGRVKRLQARCWSLVQIPKIANFFFDGRRTEKNG